jgi:hypothetical protein
LASRQATEAVRQALAALPEGTPEHDLDGARDKAIKPYLDRHAESKRKDELISVGMREVFPYLLKLETEKRLAGKASPFTLDNQLTPIVRERLQAEVTGTESPERVKRRAHHLVTEQLGLLALG